MPTPEHSLGTLKHTLQRAGLSLVALMTFATYDAQPAQADEPPHDPSIVVLPPEATPDPHETTETTQQALVITNTALRIEPTQASRAVTRLRSGTIVRVIEQVGSWWLVQRDGDEPGWGLQRSFELLQAHPARIRLDTVLHTDPTTDSLTVSPLQAGDPVMILTKQGGWVLIQLPSDEQGWALASDVEVQANAPRVGIAQATLRLRAEASTESAVVGSLVAGEPLQIVGETTGQPVTLNGITSDVWYEIVLAEGRHHAFVWSGGVTLQSEPSERLPAEPPPSPTLHGLRLPIRVEQVADEWVGYLDHEIVAHYDEQQQAWEITPAVQAIVERLPANIQVGIEQMSAAGFEQVGISLDEQSLTLTNITTREVLYFKPGLGSDEQGTHDALEGWVRKGERNIEGQLEFFIPYGYHYSDIGLVEEIRQDPQLSEALLSQLRHAFPSLGERELHVILTPHDMADDQFSRQDLPTGLRALVPGKFAVGYQVEADYIDIILSLSDQLTGTAFDHELLTAFLAALGKFETGSGVAAMEQLHEHFMTITQPLYDQAEIEWFLSADP